MLKLENVSKFYYNKGLISSGITKVNLELNLGEFVAITGESGSGKSTLLNVISGLDSYEEGEMYINGKETSHYTEKEFETTYEFLKKIKFYKTHIFKYSPRRGTAAEKMPNQVDGKIKEERSKTLIELSNKNELDYNQSYIGKDIAVLIEEKEGDFYKGHTGNYILSKVKSDKDIVNKIVKVRVYNAEEEFVEAK